MPQIAGKEVGPIGFGLMSLTRPGVNLSDEEAFAVLKAALDCGANFWNGGEFYGPESANSLVLLEKYFARYPEDADRVVLSIKGGMDKPNTYRPDSSPANVRRSVLDCAAQLRGRKTMDVFEVGRQDGVTPWATTVAAYDALVAEGGMRHFGMTEVHAETVHRVAEMAAGRGVGAGAGGGVAACEEELSLLCRDVLTDGVAAACAAHAIPLVAYSPVGRGLLTGAVRSSTDVPAMTRRIAPRLNDENLPANLALARAVEALAARKGCTPAQLAINWVRCLSLRPGMPQTIVPIPGGSTVAKVRENSVVVDLTAVELDEIEAVVSQYEVKGARYAASLPAKS